MSDFPSLKEDARSKPSATDRWGFLPDAKCKCGRKLGYAERSLKRETKVPVMKPDGTATIAAVAYVCRCGAAYSRGMSST